MHPVSTALFLLGYGLGLPILFRLTSIIAVGNRVAFFGHQVGFTIATLGWVISGRVVMALLHVAWLIGARLWFSLAGNRASSPT